MENILKNLDTTNLTNDYFNLESLLKKNNSETETQTYYFKNNKHTFKAILKKQFYGYTIKIGGDKYGDCISISITIENDIVTKAKIAHIQSEPECGVGSILEDGDTANFIKASLQLCKHLFPSLKRIEFDDMSNIDCGISKNVKPPRHFEKPFPLSYFSIAKYGKTWYEQKFGAKMINEEAYKQYREATKILKNPIGIDFYKFISQLRIAPEQARILEHYFDPSITWHEFFNRVPKQLQCFSFDGWLTTFIIKLLNITYIERGWYIDIDDMEPTKFEMSGGARKRKTRRNRKGKILFQNKEGCL
jgi:hypothetical protein